MSNKGKEKEKPEQVGSMYWNTGIYYIIYIYYIFLTFKTDVKKIHSIEIYPPIGIVRVGDSAFSGPEAENVGWFFAPDVPSKFDTPAGHMKFKDKCGNVKRQVFNIKNL
jgi:hypothetical protein